MDVALSLIISAVTIKQIMRGWDMLSGSKKDTAWNPPSDPDYVNGKNWQPPYEGSGLYDPSKGTWKL